MRRLAEFVLLGWIAVELLACLWLTVKIAEALGVAA
jgi:hypothetical protein